MGIYSQHASTYADAGLPAFPVDARGKKPAVKGWQDATPRRTRGWARQPRLATCDGLGIVMGKPSGITEVDVDAVGDAWIGQAVERFGETPIIIRTASSKAKLWYRHNGEGRMIRPFDGQPIDILGGGFTIAPPSLRADLGASYAFQAGGLIDLDRLPTIRAWALTGDFPSDKSVTRAPEAIQIGSRNNALWQHCMTQARFCDDVEALIDVAVTWGSAFPEPLSPREAEQCARSAWGYQVRARNFLGLKKPQINAGDMLMDDLAAQPDAHYLLLMFLRWHRNRPSFAIAPTAMSEAGTPPWPRRKIEKARDALLERGYLIEVSAPQRGVKAGHYRLSPQIGRSAHNHYTSSLLASPLFAGGAAC